MSQNASLQSSTLASPSTAPQSTTVASYHPLPRPQPLLPLTRVDTLAIKQELHDALGENGLAYWKAVNGYLIGQLSRKELEGMVRSWLKGDKLQLHNKLLISLLHNASTPIAAPSLQRTKRKRLAPYDPEFDIDETVIEPKLRISHWVSALTSRDRARLRRIMNSGSKVAVNGTSGEGGIAGDGEGGGGEGGKEKEKEKEKEDMEEKEGEEWEAKRRAKSSYTPKITLPPFTVPDRALPSSHQITSRLGAIARANDLTLSSSTDSTESIGDFLSLGLDSHLGEIMHGLVHLTGRDRPGSETIRLPHAHSNDGLSNGAHSHHQEAIGPDLPKPDIDSLRDLFVLNPGLNPNDSPAVYSLTTNHLSAQIQSHQPLPTSTPDYPLHSTTTSLPPSRPSSPPLSTGPSAPIVPMSFTSHHPASIPQQLVGGCGGAFLSHRAEAVGKNLLESGLMKADKEEEEKGEKGGKKRKHGLHWKYEDPALILRDVLG